MAEFNTVQNPLSSDLMPFDHQVKESDDALPKNNYLIWLINGKKGSGKSTLILNMLKRKSSPYYKQFDNIYFISPTAGRGDHKFDGLVKELESEGKFYDELNDEVIDEITRQLNEFNDEYIQQQEEANEKRKKKLPIEKPNNLIILDDCLHMLPKSNASSNINKLFTTNRHLKTSIWCLVQKYNKVNTLMRTNADLLTIFPNDNAQEFKTISDDWAIDPQLLDKVYKFATNEPNSFLHMSLFGRRPKFFKKFDKILI